MNSNSLNNPYPKQERIDPSMLTRNVQSKNKMTQNYSRGQDRADRQEIQDNVTSYDDDEQIDVKEIAKTTTTSPTDLDKITTLTLKLKKKIIQSSSFVDQSYPLLATLNVDDVPEFTKVPIDLVCVIDKSGSMNGEKMEYVHKTFGYLMEYLGDNDRLSVVAFDNGAYRVSSLRRMTAENKVKTIADVNNIYAGGGTNIQAGMAVALQILTQRKYVNNVSSVFLLSDGLDRGAEDRVKDLLLQYTDEKSQFTLHTFGYGNNHDPKLMTDIADLREGTFYFIEDFSTVDETFVSCLGGLISAVSKNVEIRIQPVPSEILPEISIVKAYGDSTMWKVNNGVYTTTIAQLITGKARNYVLEVKIPKNSKEIPDEKKNIVIASAEATLNDLFGNKITKKANLEIMLINETEEVKDNDDDLDVMKNYYRVKGAEVLNDARQFADAGKFEEAEKSLKSLKEELENSAFKSNEFIQNLVKDIDQALIDCKPQEYKTRGKANMMGNARAQMKEMEYVQSNNCYKNKVQSAMVMEQKMKKKN